MLTSPTKKPIVLIHGLWMHPESWHNWIEFFKENGYEAIAASWPGDAETMDAARENPNAVAGYGVTEIADHIAEQLKALDQTPILIGHSFGGLLVQNLLCRELAAAGIAIDSAPIKGVPELPFSAIRATLPVLGNPLNFKRAVKLTEPQFRYGFTNAVSREEAKELYEKYVVPTPARPLFQAATASFNAKAATTVNAANDKRGPLLLIAGSKDHIVPPVLVRSALRVHRRSSSAVTDFKKFEDRGHSLVIDSGWQDIAGYCLGWLKLQRFLSEPRNIQANE